MKRRPMKTMNPLAATAKPQADRIRDELARDTSLKDKWPRCRRVAPSGENARQRCRPGDRPGPVSAINVVRRRMPAVALIAGRARRAAAGLCEPRRAHPRTVAALPYRPG